MDDEWLTTEEVVRRAKLASRESLYAMRSRGRGPRGYKIGRELRFKASDIAAWMERNADPQDGEG